MNRLVSSFVLAYHGCDETVAESLLAGKPFKPKKNSWDWLGTGIYFWEANPERGLSWAYESMGRKGSSIVTPSVVGAVVELGRCLDLTTQAGLEYVKLAYDDLVVTLEESKSELPVNTEDKMRRNLDCAVINRLHTLLKDSGYETVQTVRGVFAEGGEVYTGSGFEKKTHIQIAVVDPTCIKAVFRPRPYPKYIPEASS